MNGVNNQLGVAAAVLHSHNLPSQLVVGLHADACVTRASSSCGVCVGL